MNKREGELKFNMFGIVGDNKKCPHNNFFFPNAVKTETIWNLLAAKGRYKNKSFELTLKL